jgi:hypothetical protein
MRKVLVMLALAVSAAAVPSGAQTAPVPNPALPLVQGPDVVAVNDPVSINVFDYEHFDGCAGKVVATKDVDIPQGSWDRAVLHFTGIPDGDPWDRLYSVAIDGVEVLRGTTPRAPFEIRRDVTEYLSLLPSGGRATFSLNFATYVGQQIGSLVLELYENEATSLVSSAPYDEVLGAFDFASLNGSGRTIATHVEFPASVSAATVDLTLSNHGSEEAQFTNRVFHVLVDGVEVAVARPMPYTYAIVGTGAANANSACTGAATSPQGDLLHPLMWWTAQRGLDAAGVHTGTGEIPPYRAQIVDPAALALLSGARKVEVTQTGGGAVWITSLSFLLTK